MKSPLLLGATDERQKATRIAATRIAIGAGALLTTGLARVIFGLPQAQDTPAARFLARAFGIREIALGTWVLAVQDRDVEQRRLCYMVNATVDPVDLAALLWAFGRRQRIDRFVFSSSALAISAALAWFELLQETDRLEPVTVGGTTG